MQSQGGMARRVARRERGGAAAQVEASYVITRIPPQEMALTYDDSGKLLHRQASLAFDCRAGARLKEETSRVCLVL